MNRRLSGLDPEWQALLQRRKIQRDVPPETRRRVLAAGRAIIAADGHMPPRGERPLLLIPPPRPRPLARIALAGAGALAFAAVGAVAAIMLRSPGVAPRLMVPASPEQHPAVKAALIPPAEDALPSAEPQPRPGAAPGRMRRARVARVAADRDAATVELELLQRAHADYTRRDFAATLAVLAEHARRFPHGRLAEEREILRVRALVGAGRTDEARVAQSAFAAQFPRSVLTPRAGDNASAPPAPGTPD